MDFEVEEIPEKGTFFSKIDHIYSVQDYLPFRPCIRLIGVTKNSFDHALFNSEAGCWTFLIDLGCEALLNGPYHWHRFVNTAYFGAPPFPWDAELDNQWLRIDYELSKTPTSSYSYALFADKQPQYLNVEKIEFYLGASVVPLPASSKTISKAFSGARTKLTAFHVGQGMCSLMDNGHEGYLLDAGAGTPIRRDDYRHGLKTNDLQSAIKSVSDLSVIISHPDSDHWRLLDWDSGLRNQTKNVYLPSGVPALAFKSPGIKGKVHAMGDAVLTLDSTSELLVYRSDPSSSDRNGECLVAHAKIGAQKALLPGDYVYSRMLSDRRADKAISQLGASNFDAVIVPHHGDMESASCFAGPSKLEQSIAFFSAGTHAGYRHPTNESLTNHKSRGFAIVDQHWLSDIVAKPLLP